MTGWTIFWLMKCDMLIAMTMMLAIVVALYGLSRVWGTTNDEGEPIIDEDEILTRWLVAKVVWAIAAIMIVCALFIPTTKEAVAIYTVPKVVNSELGKQLPTKLLDLLDAQIEELRGN